MDILLKRGPTLLARALTILDCDLKDPGFLDRVLAMVKGDAPMEARSRETPGEKLVRESLDATGVRPEKWVFEHAVRTADYSRSMDDHDCIQYLEWVKKDDYEVWCKTMEILVMDREKPGFLDRAVATVKAPAPRLYRDQSADHGRYESAQQWPIYPTNNRPN